ncbi:heme-degrading domain-containing protein [uncultured Devosia sp.]|uniref:heme-degrading domain-containing protein n=1 Tax=uncultured Devosia sp. TaxID=211434 RepID=UPI0035CC141F
MEAAADIALIKRQEQELVLPAFDEHVAFALGSGIYQRAVAESLSLVVDVRSWDRQMFFAATPGTTADNAEWVRRKINTVRRFQRASYRMVVERGGDAVFSDIVHAPASDYVIAGGGFPLRVRNAGIIGCLTISGLPGRSDHGVAVAALCRHLGLDERLLALPPD